MSTSHQPGSLMFPVLPLKNSVLFPEIMMPLVVGRGASVAAVEEASSSEDKTIIVASQKNGSVAKPTYDDLFHIATLAVINKMERGREGVRLVVQGKERVVLVQDLSSPDQSGTEPAFLKAEVHTLQMPEDYGTEVEALHREVLAGAERIVAMIEPQAQAGVSQLFAQLQDPLRQVYLLASMLPLSLEKDQAILAASSRAEALRLMVDYMAHEAQVLQLRQKIASQAQTEMSREQREYLLRQQMRAIQEELGEGNAEQAALGELRDKLAELDLPEHVRSETLRELTRLEHIPAASPEHQLTRSYIELVLELPWNRSTEDNLDLEHVQSVLDEDHYDLAEVKDRIIEQLAVLKLNPRAKSPILCFVGPPGVGKTSLGQSIARSMGRHFERMSLGGMHDEAELRGHRRTYIGAMPGRIVQALRRAGVRNPVLMLDEIDKVGRDYRGDPTSALLEVLDPAQNNEFRDNYLNLPFDLSEVFFITTANTLDTVPLPLLDRMELLRLSGYTDQEKVKIAQKYLIPRQLQQAGLSVEQLSIPVVTLEQVIRRYTREAGMRELERAIGRVCRKVATRYARGDSEPATIRVEDLASLLGTEKFFQEDARQDLAPGVAAGLAYTPSGGEVLYVEAVLLPNGRDIKLTGKLGDVMKESAAAAQSFIHSWADHLGIEPEMLQRGVHVHVPAGATPKDGPSAGVTIATALTSLLVGSPARSDTAMTGEITLSGLVLPVGGIKEKVLAAHRAHLQRVILPRRNEPDLATLPDEVREQLEFVLVDRIDEALSAALPELSVTRELVH